MYQNQYGDDFDEREIDALQRRYAGSSVGSRFVPWTGWGSQAELDFATTLGKYLGASVEFSPGQNVRPQVGRFRPDMILRFEGRVVGLEVDGRDFHKDLSADYLRDTALLAARFVHVIYRFAASSTHYRPEDCLYVLSQYEPRAFDLKAREMLIPRLASPFVRGIEEFRADGVVLCGEPPDESDYDGTEEPDLEPHIFHVSRRTLTTSVVRRTNIWMTKVLARHGSIPFDVLKEMYKQAVEKAGAD